MRLSGRPGWLRQRRRSTIGSAAADGSREAGFSESPGAAAAADLGGSADEDRGRAFASHGEGVAMRRVMLTATFALFLSTGPGPAAGGDDRPADGWRALPLIKEGKVDPAWVQVGYGGFSGEDGGLRTERDEKGLGLLLYRKEKFGDCQVRVVYKCKDARSNSGVFVRIDDGILGKVNEKHAPASRDSRGQLTKESLQIFKDASEKELGPWYA